MEPFWRLTLLVLALVFSASSLGWLLGNYASVQADYGFGRSLAEIKTMLPRPTSYFLADDNPLVSIVGSWVDGIPMRHEHQLFLGVAVWVLMLVGLGQVFHRSPLASLGRVCAISIGILVLATLSVHGQSLYPAIASLPGFGAVRAVSRISHVILFPVAALVAIGSQAVVFRWHGLTRKVAAFSVVALALGIELSGFKSSNVSIGEMHARIDAVKQKLPAELPQGAILYVARAAEIEPVYVTELDGMLTAQSLNIPTLNGYSGNAPPGYVLPDPCVSPVNRLYGYALSQGLSTETMDALSTTIVTAAMSDCGNASKVIGFFGDVDSEVIAGLTAEFVSVTGNDDWVTATIRLTNNSSKRFDTLSLSGQPVRLSWRMVKPDADQENKRQPKWDKRKDVFLSLEAGDSDTVTFSFSPPKKPHKLLLEVSLVQDGVLWFHDHGFEVLRVPLTSLLSIGNTGAGG